MERYELPEGWKWKRIGEISKVVSGSTPKTNVAEYWNGNILWATPKDLGKLSGITINNTERTITEHGFNSCSAQMLPPGSVLLTSRAPIGHLAINTMPMCTNQGFKNLIPGPSVFNRYLYWVLKYFVRDLQHIGRGGTFEEISKKMVESFEIPLPQLSEQKRIVARIEELTRRVEEVRGLRREAVAETLNLLVSGSDKIFSKKEIHLESIELGEIAEVQSGVTLGRKLNGNKIKMPYLRVANVQDGHLNLTEIKEVEILESERHKWLLKDGDILLTEGGDWDKLGRGAVWRNEIPDCIHQNHIFRVRVDQQNYDPSFLCAYIGSSFGKAYFQQASKQTTNLASINQRQLRGFKVPRIPLLEQRRIVEYLNGLQAKADVLKRLQAETEAELAAFTPALLAKAFRGEL